MTQREIEERSNNRGLRCRCCRVSSRERLCLGNRPLLAQRNSPRLSITNPPLKPDRIDRPVAAFEQALAKTDLAARTLPVVVAAAQRTLRRMKSNTLSSAAGMMFIRGI